MFYRPHKLYRLDRLPTSVEENGDAVKDNDYTEVYVCDCFLHDIGIQQRQGYTGQGIDVNYYVNLAITDAINADSEIRITSKDGSTIVSCESIKDIKNTHGMQYAGLNNYMTIFI